MKKDQLQELILFLMVTNCLLVTPTHDAYLENGTDIGLTVGNLILAYANQTVNIP